jgi:hypothetical protein
MCQAIYVLFECLIRYALFHLNFRICHIFILKLDLQRAVLNLFLLQLLQNQASELIPLEPLARHLCPSALQLVISRPLLRGGGGRVALLRGSHAERVRVEGGERVRETQLLLLHEGLEDRVAPVLLQGRCQVHLFEDLAVVADLFQSA